ncbi:hypothetical protein [Bradyrhizobium sp. BR 10289]|uniref:hypothetical protein n=1 Tax=Bradyrhizobium sp. BR 10289 TaxID=2749993 RepID=UPI001C646F18|nr:hypothetical protein [Bradyrhizobium sp. BR 10289]MBW7970949.1 hypothetical protein [Bradyrhizobium sp. BR 10289]
MPVLTINGRQVTVDDSFLNLPREEQDATVDEIAASMPKAEPSGLVRGIAHGLKEAVHGNAETVKQFAGVGEGVPVKDEGYVPANLTNGSPNPLNWNWSQAPQKVAEGAPGLAQDALAAAGTRLLLGRFLGPLAPKLGATASAWLRTAGEDAKTAAENRTGNADAEPQAQDKLRGGLTSAASAAVGSVAPTRFLQGSGNGVAEVGARGVADAAKRWLGTTAITGASSAASDAVNQVGLTGSYDPKQGIEAAAGGAVTGGAMAAPRGLSEAARSASLSEFGGANREALGNYATRLKTEGDGKLGTTLGGAANDAAAHERVVSDLQREFKDASASVRAERPVSQDAENAMAAAARGDRITPKDLDLIENASAGTTDGDNAAYLARTLRVAQLAQSRGSYSKGQWAGGVSGALDDNLGYMLNPTRLAGGAIASVAGMHLLGLSNPLFAGSVAGAYGLSRLVDGVTGRRSPAKMFAENFADAQANLRKPPTPPVAPPQPGGAAMGPWGPKPQAPTSVPQVAPPAAPAGPDPLIASAMAHAALLQKTQPATPGTQPWQAPQVTELPQLNSVAMKMLGDKLKAGLPSEPQQAPAAATPEPPAIDPLNLPSSITKAAKNLTGGLAKVQEIREKQQAKDAVASLQSPLVADAPIDVTQNPMVGKRASQLVSAANALRKYTGADVAEREQAQAEAQAAREEKAAAKAAEREKTATERAQAAAERAKLKAEAAAAKAEQVKQKEAAKAEQVKQKEAAKAELAKAKAEAKAATDKVKAAAAKVKAPKAAPEAPAEADVPYEPLSEEHLYPRGITPKEYAQREAAGKGTRSETYMAKAEASERRRQTIAAELKAQHPKSARAIDWLARELQRVGVNPKEVARAVRYAQDNVPDDVAKAMEAFK